MERVISQLQKIDVLVLSDYIIKHYGPMSHLKLQKLLFYCDAYHLAYFDTELVSDKFEAWVHGPVCRRVYDSFKDKSVLYADIAYSYNDGDVDVDGEFRRLTTDQQDLLTDVLSTLSTWTGLQLEQATHSEAPWKNARRGYGEADKCSIEISKSETETFYREELQNEEIH